VSGPFLDGVTEHRLTRPDGRVVAWTTWGDGSVPVLQVPGTPGSRYGLRADRDAWRQRDLTIIATERPGFGSSTRLPGRGFIEHSDDLATILDALGVESVVVSGGSGAAPHELAFAARHPQRVRAVTIVGGAAPCTDVEAAQMVPDNQEGRRLALADDRAGMVALLAPMRMAILADPLGGLQEAMRQAPAADHAVMADSSWQAGLVEDLSEALAQGVDGWADESFAFERSWDEIDLSAVTASVTWWHAGSDANCPVAAAERLVRALPNARLIHFGDDEGHLAGYLRRDEILDDLLSRGAAAASTGT
jgi:pimeloyl-ACP methyl ester carboxylesterase